MLQERLPQHNKTPTMSLLVLPNGNFHNKTSKHTTCAPLKLHWKIAFHNLQFSQESCISPQVHHTASQNTSQTKQTDETYPKNKHAKIPSVARACNNEKRGRRGNTLADTRLIICNHSLLKALGHPIFHDLRTSTDPSRGGGVCAVHVHAIMLLNVLL